MGRPKKEINEKRCENFKILLQEVKKKDRTNTQKRIGERIYLSETTISDIANKRADLTESNAESIIHLFPEYRLEWLLGYDDYKTIADKEAGEAAYFINKGAFEIQQREAMMFIIRRFGYDVAPIGFDVRIVNKATEEQVVIPLSEARDYFEELSNMIENYVRFHFNRKMKERD